MKFSLILETVCERLAEKTEISREVDISCVRFMREKLKSDLVLSAAMKRDLAYLPENSAEDGSLKWALSEVSKHQSCLSERVFRLGTGMEQ